MLLPSKEVVPFESRMSSSMLSHGRLFNFKTATNKSMSPERVAEIAFAVTGNEELLVFPIRKMVSSDILSTATTSVNPTFPD